MTFQKSGTPVGLPLWGLLFFIPTFPCFPFPSNTSICELAKVWWCTWSSRVKLSHGDFLRKSRGIQRRVFCVQQPPRIGLTKQHRGGGGGGFLLSLLQFKAHFLPFLRLTGSVGLCHWWWELGTGVSVFKDGQLGRLFCNKRLEITFIFHCWHRVAAFGSFSRAPGWVVVILDCQIAYNTAFCALFAPGNKLWQICKHLFSLSRSHIALIVV